jgi:hypothetical protein
MPINSTDSMLRDNNGRLRRRTWLVTKTARCLALQLAVFQAYRNWVRQRTNRGPKGVTAGVHIGAISRQLSPGESIRWRQDWGQRSIHPTSQTGAHSVGAAAA